MRNRYQSRWQLPATWVGNLIIGKRDNMVGVEAVRT